MIEVVVDSIRASLTNHQRVVILKTKTGERYLPVWIGPAEADAIAIKLQRVAVPRPMTHDLLNSVIAALGAVIDFIVICDLRQDIFYARIHLGFGGGPLPIKVEFPPESESAGPQTAQKADQSEVKGPGLSFMWRGRYYQAVQLREWREGGNRFVEVRGEDGTLLEIRHDEILNDWSIIRVKIDSRPSDAIALAVRTQAPIYVEEVVLNKAGFTMDQESGKPVAWGLEASKGKALSEEEMRGLAAFRDFIENLDLEDFGKGKRK